MSIEADVHTLLAAHAPLAALVGTRIAQNAVPPGADYPLVVYTVEHGYDRALDGTVLCDQATVQIQCWANTPDAADAVADAVATALQDAPDGADVTVLARAGNFDPDLNLDGTQLNVEWWV